MLHSLSTNPGLNPPLLNLQSDRVGVSDTASNLNPL
jgi:hypothetical protein